MALSNDIDFQEPDIMHDFFASTNFAPSFHAQAAAEQVLIQLAIDPNAWTSTLIPQSLQPQDLQTTQHPLPSATAAIPAEFDEGQFVALIEKHADTYCPQWSQNLEISSPELQDPAATALFSPKQTQNNQARSHTTIHDCYSTSYCSTTPFHSPLDGEVCEDVLRMQGSDQASVLTPLPKITFAPSGSNILENALLTLPRFNHTTDYPPSATASKFDTNFGRHSKSNHVLAPRVIESPLLSREILLVLDSYFGKREPNGKELVLLHLIYTGTSGYPYDCLCPNDCGRRYRVSLRHIQRGQMNKKLLAHLYTDRSTGCLGPGRHASRPNAWIQPKAINKSKKTRTSSKRKQADLLLGFQQLDRAHQRCCPLLTKLRKIRRPDLWQSVHEESEHGFLQRFRSHNPAPPGIWYISVQEKELLAFFRSGYYQPEPNCTVCCWCRGEDQGKATVVAINEHKYACHQRTAAFLRAGLSPFNYSPAPSGVGIRQQRLMTSSGEASGETHVLSTKASSTSIDASEAQEDWITSGHKEFKSWDGGDEDNDMHEMEQVA
ncbi:hypothetical protein DL96DRAFT_1704863 [Flagelloscypha sp. PMI_526]|nr:hypothetical protein DL96DRAFT_1704863 [Flagelloscypha sp. PMI_526]